MDLFTVQKGKKKEPFNVILFGVPGIGKTSWAANTPSPIFVGGEETSEMDIARLTQPRTYAEFISQIDWLVHQSKNFDYKTLVIDTLDSIETLLHQQILDTDPKGTKSMIAAHGGYGKAYEIAANEFSQLKEKLKTIRNNGLNIVLLAHSKKAQAVDTILGMQYDTYELNLHQKAQSVFVDWVSAVLFANYIVHQQSGTNTDRIFATGEGERVLLTEKRPGHLGKNRFSLPYEMPLQFEAFFDAYNKFFDHGPTIDMVVLSIEGLMQNISDNDLIGKITSQLTAARELGDMQKLFRIAERVREIVK